MKKVFAYSLFFALFSLLVFVPPARAYYTSMPASVVVGQSSFSVSSANQGGAASASTVSAPRYAMIAEGKLLVLDGGNNRILIWNSVPRENNVPADVVIGQTTFSGTSSLGCTGNGIQPIDGGMLYLNGKLLILSSGQSRILVFNGIPTTNGASADYVIGQSNFTSCSANAGASQSANGFNQGAQMATDGQRLAVVDNGNNRVLIWNTLPQTSGVPANVVIGSSNFTSSDTGVTSHSFSSPRGVAFSQGKLIIGDRGNFRALIFNTVPTANGATADVVLGQSSFTANSSSPPATASTMHPFYIHADGKGRLYISDRNSSRYVIFNQIPTQNNTPADIVIGQPNFTSSTINNGGISAQTSNFAKGIWANDQYMVIADPENNRVLIYSNQIENPGISINSNQEARPNNQTRFFGNTRTNSPYILKAVEYALNGEGFQSASAEDGAFDSIAENFYFDTTLADHQARNEDGQTVDGYALQVRARNNNADQTDHAFFFSPFVLNSPADAEVVNAASPTFDFSVNRQRLLLRDNLDHYAVQVRNLSDGSGWQTVIENIPVDFASHKADVENLQKSSWENIATKNGIYETDKFLATFSDEGSRVAVRAKNSTLNGSYEWKVLAIDKSGHSQETGARKVLVVNSMGTVTPGFPLAILNISGLGNPNISSYNLAGIKLSYRTTSSAPTFFGIAWSGATVTATFTEQKCNAYCTQSFSTTANAGSRFGLNIPSKTLKAGKSYAVSISTNLDDRFTQLPTFILSVYASK